jgi:hypothetical protein
LRLKKFKNQSDFNKSLTKANRTTENFRVGKEMLAKMADIKKYDRMICLDIEAWEMGNHYLTEFGIVLYEPSSENLETFHYIIEENMKLRNGKLVPDHRDYFQLGTSSICSAKEAVEKICKLIETSAGAVALVGHGIQSDLNYILDSGLPRLPLKGITTLDTQILFMQIERNADQSRLEDVLGHFKLPSRYLHNAGNDAFYTMLIALRIAGVDVNKFVPSHLRK